jgi:hypothetical protein
MSRLIWMRRLEKGTWRIDFHNMLLLVRIIA